EPTTDTALISITGAQTIIEGETSTNYTVSVDQLAADVTRPITVDLTYSGTAEDGTDFTGVAQVIIPVGSSSVDLAEGSEDFTITLGTITDSNFENIAADASANSVESFIVDETTAGPEDTALISITGAQSIIEGETSTNYTVTVDQDASDVTSPITVDLTYSGTAEDGTDFTGVAQVIIPAGS
ncbi:hypothetical protein, partial [Neptunomonas qingdaonensis]|uniref:hypothetical protein n=1 Tax=Neptunomonas qingdaonensis TaxID=1045558 RepID=UPI0018DB1075